MKKDQNSSIEARRSFLKLASVGAVASGVAAVAGSEKAEASETGAETASRGYRATEHVRKVYDLARF